MNNHSNVTTAEKKHYLFDMDGVLVRGDKLIPGADTIINQLNEKHLEYLVFTNNPFYTPRDLSHRLHTMGLKVPETRIFTSAMATAYFLKSQRSHAKAYVIGESGLTQAIYDIGYMSTDIDPDYVILGETRSYSVEQITRAVRLISKGALFIATNPDPIGGSSEEGGIFPACGSLAALIEKATGKPAFFVGKPNPLMMRYALNHINIHSRNTVLVGDRMDTDIISGIANGMETILVLTGVSQKEDIPNFPYRPNKILNSVAELDVL